MSDAARATGGARENLGERTVRSPAVADTLWILALGALVALVLRPFQDAPFVDDWVYAWSVEELLAGRGLVILDWSSHPNFAHVLWGALFALPTGFSFVALRVSTWVAALLAVCALHLLLRELGVRRGDALVGAAVLAVNPVFFMLAATFMTDVPFVAVFLWATVLFVIALQRRSDAFLAGFVVLSCVACAVRVVAVVTPIAAVLTLLLHAGAWGRRPGRLLATLAPLLVLALLMLWSGERTVHVTDLSTVVGSPHFRRLYLVDGLMRLHELLLQTVLCVVGTLGLALLPLAVAMADRSTLRRALPVLAALAALALVAWLAGVDWPPPLAPGFIWAWNELGTAEALVAPQGVPAAPGWATAALTLAGFASFAVVATRIVRRLRAAESFLAWSAAGHVGLLAILWLSYDRYLLPLLPLLIALALAARPLLRRSAALVALALLGVVSTVGVRDHLAFNRALWDAVTRLQARGVPDAQIDAGYVVDGWLHFVDPERAPRDAEGRPFFPWITDAEGLLPYQVTKVPLPGWTVLDSVPYRRWLGSSGSLYVLAREPRAALAHDSLSISVALASPPPSHMVCSP